ncbi:MAG: uroporphyrinogen-III synthase [Rhodospirillales bacterium]|nr:MAG: uroporphyrinogen-III synthase [Rhodospirillales bacterium]
MLVLVTRPEAEARAFAETLAARGHTALLAPMLRIESRKPPAGFVERLKSAQAVLLTSANGARALAGLTVARDLPVLAVGPATTHIAGGLGFTDVRSADGDSDALVALARESLSPDKGALLHVGGAARAGDVAGALRAAGFEVVEAALYDARLADSLPDDVVRAIADGAVDAVTFFSPRTARAFVSLAGRAGIDGGLAGSVVVAISPAALAAAAGPPWRSRIAARTPTQGGILAALDSIAATQGKGSAMSDDTGRTARREGATITDVDVSRDDDPKPASSEARPAAVVQPRRGMGVVGTFIVGLIAAAVVVGGAGVAYMAQPEAVRALLGHAPKPAAPTVSPEALAAALKPLDERLAKLETRTGAVESQGEMARARIEARFADQEKRVAALAEAAAARQTATPARQPAVDIAPLQAELARGQRDLAALRAELATLKAQQETTAAAVKGMAERPAAVAAAPSTSGAPATTSAPVDVADAQRQIAALVERLDRLEKRDAQTAGALANAVDRAAVAREIAEAEARLREQIARGGGDTSGAREAAARAAERLAAIEKEVASRLDAFGKDVARRGDEGKRVAEGGRAAAVIGIAARMRQAIEAEGPFATDLDLLRPLAADDPEIAKAIAELAPLAATGVAARRALAAEFPDVARRVVAADLADDSLGERLLGKLRQLVTIRRVGDDAKGATPEAIVARAEAALAAGDVAKAVAEIRALKGPPADPARAWLARAEARLAAQGSVDRLSLHGVGLLSRAGVAK